MLYRVSEGFALICAVTSRKVTVLSYDLLYLWILLQRCVWWQFCKSRWGDLMGHRFFSHHVFKNRCLSGLLLLLYDSVTRIGNDARFWRLSAMFHFQKCLSGAIKPQIGTASRRIGYTSPYLALQKSRKNKTHGFKDTLRVTHYWSIMHICIFTRNVFPTMFFFFYSPTNVHSCVFRWCFFFTYDFYTVYFRL